MSLSLIARKAVMCGSLTGLCTSLLTAQAAYGPLGNETTPTGVLPGDQSHPRISANANGGFLVWDDNATDGKGLGIRAMGLDTLLQPAQAPFRVNFEAAGDQEDPQVALFNEGGAVFVWKGGPFGFQKVYARFLTASNTWLTGDVLISSPGSAVKATPSLSVLNNGNAIVVWSSSNERGPGSMQDVFGQVVTPAGSKVGPVLNINQFTSFNQRTPAVAALKDGGFAVSWVSEQQRRAAQVSTNSMMFLGSSAQPSVDVYARLFDDAARPRGNEFVVNAEAAVCANPAIAATTDGFIIAWSQGSATNLGNHWDVHARCYSTFGGPVQLINTHQKGAQFAPSIATLNDDVLITWISERQDGSRDGVFGQFLTKDLQPVGSEFQVNGTTRFDQNQAAVASDNFGRFIAAWRTTQIAEKVSVEICSQMYAQPGFEPLAAATNYLGPVFVGPTNSNGGPGDGGFPTHPFPGTPPGEPGDIPANAFQLAKGAYRGLLYNTNGVSAADSGYVTVSLTATRRYTMNIQLGRRTFKFAGTFDEEGNATRSISQGAGKEPIQISMRVDLFGADQLRGTLVNGQSTCEFVADRQTFNTTANRCAVSGRYNVVISAPQSESAAPEGLGHGTLLVYVDGKTSFSAKLADGTVITQGSAVSKNGIWPLYAAPYAKQGVVLGWMQVSTNGVDGNLIWSKPAGAKVYYPEGFSGTSHMEGARYARPTSGKRVLELSEGNCVFVFSGSALDTVVTNEATLQINHRIYDTASNGIRATLNPQNGLFQGSFVRPGTRSRVSFTGRLIQGQNVGVGFFLFNNASGQVLLSSPTP